MIGSVTLDDIKRVAAGHLDPDGFVLVVVADQDLAGLDDSGALK